MNLDYWAPEELEELPEIQVTLPVSEGRREGEVVPVTLDYAKLWQLSQHGSGQPLKRL